MIRIKETLT
jgi:hypothetical protein